MGILAQIGQVATSPGEAWWLALLKLGLVPVLAFIGVMITIKAHDRRLRNEQLERRAKDIQRELQQWYGNFGAACFAVADAVGERIKVEVEIVFAEISEGVNAQVADQVRETKDDSRRALLFYNERYGELRTAYGRLLLLEDDNERVLELEKVYKLVTNLTVPWCDKAADTYDSSARVRNLLDLHAGTIDVLEQVERFLRRSSELLDISYRQALTLAAKGEFPQRRVVIQRPVNKVWDSAAGLHPKPQTTQ